MNQEQYIGRNSDILPFHCLVGEVFPSVLKGLFCGTLPGVKGARYFRGIEIYRNVNENVHGKSCIRKNLDTRKNQEEYIVLKKF